MNFEIPIVIMIFKRKEKIKQIMEVISQVKPSKLYILGDGPRNETERDDVNQCRLEVENAVNWPCEIVTRYAATNMGVYHNIGEGAKWVFEREDSAIFLEDDNLPELSFFTYCENLLTRYYNKDNILWICGTNYLEKYKPIDSSDYMFTQHLLPCGWASWSHKFLKYYDGELEKTENSEVMKKFKQTYKNTKLYRQQLKLILAERDLIKSGKKPLSWDYQMEFSLRSNNLFGISPRSNLIKNIGVDEHSIHGGSDSSFIMTQRFCGMESFGLNLPFNHPPKIKIDIEYEEKIGNIILQPFSLRIKNIIGPFVKTIFKINDDTSIKVGIMNFFKNK